MTGTEGGEEKDACHSGIKKGLPKEAFSVCSGRNFPDGDNHTGHSNIGQLCHTTFFKN